MSRLFKRPKPIINMGNQYARLIKSARNIQNQAELDQILAQVPREMGEAWLNVVKEHMRFVPRQVEVKPVESDTVADESQKSVL